MPSLLSRSNLDRCCRSAAGRCDPRPPGPLLEHPLPLQVLAARRLLEHPLPLQAMSHKSSSGGRGDRAVMAVAIFLCGTTFVTNNSRCALIANKRKM